MPSVLPVGVESTSPRPIPSSAIPPSLPAHSNDTLQDFLDRLGLASYLDLFQVTYSVVVVVVVVVVALLFLLLLCCCCCFCCCYAVAVSFVAMLLLLFYCCYAVVALL